MLETTLNIATIKGAINSLFAKHHPLPQGQLATAALLKDSLATGELYWVDGRPPLDAIECAAKTRYRQPDQPCRLMPQKRGCRVEFAEARRAITPGQSVVFYQGDLCLGGGIIESAVSRITDIPDFQFMQTPPSL